MRSLLGKKIGMTTIFSENGTAVPVTVIAAGPCVVIQKKTADKEGYNALQLGYEPLKTKTKTVERDGKSVKKSVRPNAPMGGHFKASGGKPFRHLYEMRVKDPGKFNLGDSITLSLFEKDKLIDVIGTSKGRGFAGGVKRHHWRGGDNTHGSMHHRAAGSIGSSSAPSRVFKNVRMAGHMGDARVTSTNLAVVKVDLDKNLILVRGAVPGRNGGIVTVREAQHGKLPEAK